jgi:PAS domain S-box-containing protein
LVLTISVLCVDDETPLLEIFQRYLERTKEFTVTTASSAPAALHLLKSNGIQAIVSDYQMPGMDGIAFLKQVRVANKHIPFIMFTGKGWEAIAIEAFENGADFYLQKGGTGSSASSYADLMHKIKMAVEQRRVERALADSELQYRRLFETAQDAILILNGETGEVIDANKFILDMLGYPREYFVGKHLWELGFIKDKTLAQNAFTELKTSGYIRYEDLPLETKDGRSMDVEFISNVYPVGDKKIIQCNIRDITERKVIQDALQASETRYRRLFETAQDGILILDEETGKIIDANTFVLDMLGYPLEYFIGKHLWELGFIKDKTIAENAFTDLKTSGFIRYEDLPLETRDGRTMDVEFISNVYPVGDKKIIQCNIRDITERKVIQDALQASETRYRRLFETAQDGILILEEETGKIIDANTFILHMLGYPLEYFIGKHLWEVGFIRDKTIAEKAFSELKTKGYIRYEDLPLETKDGRSMDVEFISNVYPVNHHKVIQCNIRDITERKDAEVALSLAVRKLNLLSSITRHDIKNQILALEGFLDLSREDLGDPARMSEYIAKEKKIVETIAYQISFTKEYEDMGLKAPVWQNVTSGLMRVITRLPMQDIRVDAGDPGLEVFADPLLEKVFYNLIDNALRYGGEKMTAIRVRDREDNGKLVISVEDDGNGISAEDKTQLFTRGFGRHTGLGLYISREILSITGITITENGEPGKGARFEMVVPPGEYRGAGAQPPR